jgi:hypothetical protein
MNDQICQCLKGSINSCRLLLLVFLLSSASAGFSDERVAKTDPAANIIQTPGEYGGQNDGRLKEKPRIEDLGQGKYRIGKIVVDKAKQLITIPGTMLPYEDNKAIEFLASTKQGYKAYESVVMLDVNAFEFNLACILIGLDAKQSVSPKFHFDPEPVKGDPVSIRVSWEENGKQVEYDILQLLKVGKTKPAGKSVWIYTGSKFINGDVYLAEIDGVLIGLIHDPASIIEHRDGLGLGNWGAISIDPDTAPKSGQALIIKIKAVD